MMAKKKKKKDFRFFETHHSILKKNQNFELSTQRELYL